MHCAICHRQMLSSESTPYAIGPLHGRLCLPCQEGLSGAVGRWLGGRMQEVEREREAAERLDSEARPLGLRVVKLMGVRQ